MYEIELDDATYGLVRFAARMFKVSEAEVIARAVRELSRPDQPDAPRRQDPWEPVPVYGDYGGRRVDGLYLPATRRLTVTSEPLAGRHFKSPSGAARAVVAALNPDRESTQTNGWRFWHLNSTGERLEALRRLRAGA
jgi:hypothetical protein